MTARTVARLSAGFIRWTLAIIASLSWSVLTMWLLSGACVVLGWGESSTAFVAVVILAVVAGLLGLGLTLDLTASEEE